MITDITDLPEMKKTTPPISAAGLLGPYLVSLLMKKSSMKSTIITNEWQPFAPNAVSVTAWDGQEG